MKSKKIGKLSKLMIAMVFIAMLAGVLNSCNNKKQDDSAKKYANGVFIINEGNFQFGNASVSFYDPATQKIESNIFETKNGFKLGDVAQSMTIVQSLGYIVMNNSQKVVVVDALNDFKFLYSIPIDGSSPRYMQQVNDSTAYVSDLYANKIWVVDTKVNKVRKSIAVNGWTEQIIGGSGFAVATQRPKPGTTTGSGLLFLVPGADILFETFPLSSEPNSMVQDKAGNLWVLCSGDSMNGVHPLLLFMNGASANLQKTFTFPLSSHPQSLRYSPSDDQLYFLDAAIFRMNVSDDNLPTSSFISTTGKNIYGMNIDPKNGDVYVSDAIDYVQSSKIYRYGKDGNLIQSFNAGIITNGFVFTNE